MPSKHAKNSGIAVGSGMGTTNRALTAPDRAESSPIEVCIILVSILPWFLLLVKRQLILSVGIEQIRQPLSLH